jgi:hypothetical protein
MPPAAGGGQVEPRLAGDLEDRAGRVLQRLDVGPEIPVALCRRGVAPAHGEHLEALLDRELDEAPPRRQIEDVVLVDLRRDEKERPREHARRRRLVLDELEHLAAEDDLAGRRRQALADAERPAIDLRRQAAVLAQVVREVARAREQALAARRERVPERGRVAGEAVGRRQRLGDERQREATAHAALRIEMDLVHDALDPGAPGEIALHEAAVDRVFTERRVGPASVARVGRSLRAAEGDIAELVAHLGEHAADEPGLEQRAHPDAAGGGEELRAVERDQRVHHHRGDGEALGEGLGGRWLRALAHGLQHGHRPPSRLRAMTTRWICDVPS